MKLLLVLGVLGALFVNGYRAGFRTGVEAHAATGATLSKILGGVKSSAVEARLQGENILGASSHTKTATFAMLG
jgi:hypothetical protein